MSGAPISWPFLRSSARDPTIQAVISGLQKGPAERGHVKKRQKSSKSVKKFFDTFRQFSRRAKNVKNRQKASKSVSTLFSTIFARHTIFFYRPLLGGSDVRGTAAIKGIFDKQNGLGACHGKVCSQDHFSTPNPQVCCFYSLEGRNLLKLRSLDSSCPFFLSDNSIWAQ